MSILPKGALYDILAARVVPVGKENCSKQHTLRLRSLFDLRIHDIVMYRDLCSSTRICQGPSPSPKSEFKRARLRCEIISRYGRSGKKGWRVSRKGNRLRTGESRKECHVPSGGRRKTKCGE